MTTPAETLRQRIAEHPEWIAAAKAFADLTVRVGLEIAADFVLVEVASIPVVGGAAAALAGVVVKPLEAKLDAIAESRINAALDSLASGQPAPTTHAGSRVAGLVEISVSTNAAPSGSEQ
jgi:hypothetical protein